MKIDKFNLPMQELKFFAQDVNRLIGKDKLRIIQVFFSRIFWGLLGYRLERTLLHIFKGWYRFVRIPLAPFFFLIQAYSNIEIHYEARIAGGLLIHHASAGIVISGHFSAGRNLTLTGGNIIGIKFSHEDVAFKVGDNVYLGANATIVGPVVLGNNIRIGSLCCVTKSFLNDNIALVGVPAKKITQT